MREKDDEFYAEWCDEQNERALEFFLTHAQTAIKKHTFVVTVSQRDDLPDSVINEDYVRGLLTLGNWLELVDIKEIQQ